MNSRERVLAHIEGQPVDRLPLMPITMMLACQGIGARYRDYCTDYRVLVEGQIHVAETYGFDYVNTMSDPAREAADCGAAIEYFENQPVAILEDQALLTEKTTLATLKIPDPLGGGRMHNGIRAIGLFKERVGNEKMVEGWVEGPIAEASDLRGINTLMTDYYDDADFVHALAAFTVDNALKFATAQIEAGADIIGLGDAAASLVGRELYDEFVFPHEQKLIDGIHAAGGKVRLHICGRTIQLADALAKLGCEIVDLDTLVDLRAARTAMGDRQVLLGNIHTVNVVKNGTVDDVRRELAKCRADAGAAWIAGAGCELPRHSPPENVRCFAKI